MQVSPEDYDLLLELAASFDVPAFDPEKHVLLSDLADKWGLSDKATDQRMQKQIDGDAPWRRIKVRGVGTQNRVAYEKIE